jgi:hypothetical protein
LMPVRIEGKWVTVHGEFCTVMGHPKKSAAPVGQGENQPHKSEIIGAVARGWCHEKNSAKIFDSDLANAIVEEVCKLRASTLHTASAFAQIYEIAKGARDIACCDEICKLIEGYTLHTASTKEKL